MGLSRSSYLPRRRFLIVISPVQHVGNKRVANLVFCKRNTGCSFDCSSDECACYIQYLQQSKPEREDENNRHVQSDEAVLRLIGPGSPCDLSLFRLLFWVGYSSLWISVQKFLPIGACRREDCIIDWNPARQDTGHPNDGRPKCMGKKRQ